MVPEGGPHHLSNLVAIYRERFDERALMQKNRVWKVICEVSLQRYIGPADAVLDLGAGTCEFINNITCGKKYAVDINPDTERFAARDVVVLRPEKQNSIELEDGTVNVVFASNFFEHLPTRQSVIDTLREVRRVLAPGGKLIIVGPNVKYLYMEYWDYFDHQLALSEKSMHEAIITCGFEVETLKARFLPYTFRSRYPKGRFFVKTYLKLPILHRVLGKQMLIVARKR
ncbi:MAG: class I SAM-dependent methyltransferase [Candidatus Abyssobacteria bacterium SURF_17]|jgi:SAM-dependent methyltransferase|uniref:Class I SAM-dependent methyltransferase n=1 Tax=Candidatus Abyssobacteria bacterium SURF_17 TaxID=2093361 RepID=A0A419F6D1_9BACT|nr:MAG: class I SAM-dependent methyltransferase [Candidatus Abyssubacteria bacterium SURF_17]